MFDPPRILLRTRFAIWAFALSFFGLMFLTSAGVILVMVLPIEYRDWRATSTWNSADGVVTTSRMVPQHSGPPKWDVRAAFDVNGQTRVAKRYLGPIPSTSTTGPMTFPVGTTTLVYHHPNHLGDAFIGPGPGVSRLVMVAITGVTGVTVGPLFLCTGWKLVRRPAVLRS